MNNIKSQDVKTHEVLMCKEANMLFGHFAYKTSDLHTNSDILKHAHDHILSLMKWIYSQIKAAVFPLIVLVLKIDCQSMDALS